MEQTVKEIAAILRSTEDMADRFTRRVQERVGQPASADDILAVMKAMSSKSLSMDKVVAKVQQQQKRKGNSSARRRTTTRTTASPLSRRRTVSNRKTASARATVTRSQEPKTLAERLGAILQDNWDRAEAEGLKPERMSAEEFVKAVYHYTDRREATRQRILKAMGRLDKNDVLLTPALVADAVHELFQA